MTFLVSSRRFHSILLFLRGVGRSGRGELEAEASPLQSIINYYYYKPSDSTARSIHFTSLHLYSDSSPVPLALPSFKIGTRNQIRKRHETGLIRFFFGASIRLELVCIFEMLSRFSIAGYTSDASGPWLLQTCF